MTPTEPKWKKSLRDTMNKVQDFVTDPKTRKVAQVGTKAVELASQISQANLSGPLGIAGMGIGILNAFVNVDDKDNFTSTAKSIVAKRKLVPTSPNGAISLLFDHGFFNSSTVLATSEEITLRSIKVGEGDELAVAVQSGALAPWWDAYVSSPDTLPRLNEELWKNLGNTIALSVKKNVVDSDVLTAVPIMAIDGIEYLGENDPKEFAAKVNSYKEAKISRAYLLVGPPGTGKTTFCYKLAEEVGGRILFITPDVLSKNNIPHKDIIDLTGTFKPNVLVLEDLDRVEDTGLLLSLVDFIRKRSPLTTLISTANNRDDLVEALLRPGRLGTEVSFEAPDEGWRKKIISSYTKKFGVKRDITHLAAIMEHPRFTQDFIREVCEQALLEDDAGLEIYIRETIESFGAGDEEDSEDPPTSVD